MGDGKNGRGVWCGERKGWLYDKEDVIMEREVNYVGDGKGVMGYLVVVMGSGRCGKKGYKVEKG